MATTRVSATDTELSLRFDNGDYAVMKETVKRFGFRDEESMLRFLIAALSKSATRSLIITDANGARVNINPSADLLAPVSTPPAPPAA